MDTLRAFLDHLYYSLVIVLVGLIGLYVALYVLDTALEAILFPVGFKEFSVRSHVIKLLMLWLAGSLALAGFLTYQSIRNRPQDHIVHTKRHH
jgi:hypothetical protein